MSSRLASPYVVFFLFMLLLSITIVGYVFGTIISPYTRLIRIEQLFALSAFTALYIYFLITPLLRVFPRLRYKKYLTENRELLIVMTWYFGLLHTLLAFFGQLGGFSGLLFLSNTYLLSISLSFTALMLLSFWMILFTKRLIAHNKKIGKYLHWLLSLVGGLVLVHALLVGTHFADLSSLIPQTFLIAFFVYCLLSARVADIWLSRHRSLNPPIGFAFGSVVAVFFCYMLMGLLFPQIPVSVGLHAEHLKSLKQKSNMITGGSLFVVRPDFPATIYPTTEIPLSFSVFSQSANQPILSYDLVNEKQMHVIIVDSSLTYFNHLHPIRNGNRFSLKTSFPEATTYHLYTEYEPTNATEQLAQFTVSVGEFSSKNTPPPPDLSQTKVFGQFTVELTIPSVLKASALNQGETKFSYTLRNSMDASPVTNLKPYLGSFGHMVMIQEGTYSYFHVHPAPTKQLTEQDEGGPTVSFYPLGQYKQFTPGNYRIFVQFKPGGELFTADFTVRIE